MAMTDRLQTEQEHHRRAFELYCSLEGKRSYDKVAEAMQVASSTVRLWARSFGWQQRLREREAQQTRQIADRVLRQGQADCERNLKIVRAALMRLAKGIALGQVKMQMGDLDRLVRLEGHLVEQQAGSRTDLSALTDDELMEQLREFRDQANIDLAAYDAKRAVANRPPEEATPTHGPKQPTSD